MYRQLFVVTALTAIAQMAGFLKLWITAKLFGVSPELDGYFLALVVPTMISGILSGVLQTALFPVRARLAENQEASVVARFERGVLLILFVVGIAVGSISLMVSPQIINWNGDRLTPSVYQAILFVLPFAALLIPLNAVGDGVGYLLAMRNRYPVAAAAPVVNALFGSVLLVLWPEGGLLNLALGTVLGLGLQVMICFFALKGTQFHLLGPLPRRKEFALEWREMSRLSAWILPGIFFSNLTATLPPVLLASYGEGAVSAFGYAWKFHLFSIQLLVMASSPVLLAHLAEWASRDEEHKVRRLLVMGLWFSLTIGLLAILTVAFLGQFLLSVIFHGKFDAAAAAAVTGHWLWLTWALAPALLGNFCAKVWQARKMVRLMSLLAALGFFVFLVAHRLLSDVLDSHSVAAAVGISSLAVTAAGWRFAWKPVYQTHAPTNHI